MRKIVALILQQPKQSGTPQVCAEERSMCAHALILLCSRAQLCLSGSAYASLSFIMLAMLDACNVSH